MSTADVAAFAEGLELSQVPSTVVKRAKLATIDILGCAIAGRQVRSAAVIAETERQAAPRRPEAGASLLFEFTKLPITNAAFVASAYASALDGDDGYVSSHGHLCHMGACVIPAALAVAEAEGASGRQLLEAIIVGYEVTIRAAAALTDAPREQFTYAGTPAAYGAAAATAKLLRLSQKQIISAIGIAEAYAPRPRPGRLTTVGPMTKEALPWGTTVGVKAALLAGKEYSAPFTVFDELSATQALPNVLTLGKEFELSRAYIKRYCSCRFMHAAIDAVLDMGSQLRGTMHDVASIRIEVGEGPARLSAKTPETLEHAQFSYPFCVAAALIEGDLGPEQMSESRLGDGRILELASRIEVMRSVEWEKRLPATFGATVIIEMKNGITHSRSQAEPYGAPSQPMSEFEIWQKFFDWVKPHISTSQAEEIIKTTEALDGSAAVTDLLAVCQLPRGEKAVRR